MDRSWCDEACSCEPPSIPDASLRLIMSPTWKSLSHGDGQTEAAQDENVTGTKTAALGMPKQSVGVHPDPALTSAGTAHHRTVGSGAPPSQRDVGPASAVAGPVSMPSARVEKVPLCV